MRKKFDIEEFMNREFYIVDCKNFIFFPRKVKVSGFELSYNSQIRFFINVKDCKNEPRAMYQEELEEFKNFDKARRHAEKLNEIPENKKRAKLWNNPQSQYKILLMEQELKGDLDFR